MLCGDNVYHNGWKETRVNLILLKPEHNTVAIGCRVNEKGYLEFIMDGKNHGVVWSKPLPMDRPLWGFVDLPIEYIRTIARYIYILYTPLCSKRGNLVYRISHD